MASYRVFMIDSGAVANPREITPLVLSMPLVTDTGGLEVNSAEIVLNSPNGEFLTTGEIIKDYQRFYIELTDDDKNIYRRVFEYAPQDAAMKIEETAKTGRIITMNLLGIEYHWQKINYLKTHRWTDAKTVSEDLQRAYARSASDNQPRTLSSEDDLNEFPTHTANNYPWAETPLSCWDRLYQLATSLAAPPANGGLLDFYTNSFDMNENQVRQGQDYRFIKLKAHPLGSTPDKPITIEEGELVTAEDDRETGRSPPEANRVIGLFERTGGTFPTEFQVYQGRVERFLNLPVWRNDVSYIRGEEVRPSGNTTLADPIYRWNRDTPSAPGTALSTGSGWSRITFGQFAGDVTYSPLTRIGTNRWRNMGIDPTNTGYGRAMPDFNRVIKTDEYFNVPVDWVVPIGSRDPNTYVVGNDDLPNHLVCRRTGIPRGTTILLLSSRGASGGTDTSIRMYDNGWAVKYRLAYGTGRDIFVTDHGTGLQFVLQNEGKWVRARNTDGNIYRNPAVSRYAAIGNVQGVVPAAITDTLRDSNGSNINSNSAIQVIYRHPPFTLADLVIEDRKISGAIDRSDSIIFKFPYPFSILQTRDVVGGIIAGGTKNIIDNDTDRELRSGFNNQYSEDLGKINSIQLAMRVNHVRVQVLAPVELKVRCAIRDMYDSMVIQDFTLPFNNKWENINLPISSFRPYRALPIADFGESIIARLGAPPPVLEELDTFRWDRVRDISFTYMRDGVYDGGNRSEGIPTSPLHEELVSISIDALRFDKELVVMSPPTEGDNLEKIIRVPGIFVDSQARSFVAAEAERVRFPKTDFILDVRGRFDIRYGDSFFYKNPAVITGEDNADTNTIKLVAYSIEHSFTDRGELRTRIFCGKRFE